MRDNKNFYIGWQTEMPPPQRKLIRRFVILVLILIPILTISVSWQQKSFNDHQFELGKTTEISGLYLSSPVPTLIAQDGALSDELSPHILLVGYGKFGAEGIMQKIEEEEGPLDGKMITLSGTLIYGAGHTVMELTKKEAALVSIQGQGPEQLSSLPSGNMKEMRGEILDPKCYFGVMKPGEGKIHKSCAIRCISGGIAPVFRTPNADNNSYAYYILLGPNGEKINQDILALIAEKVNLKGKVLEQEGWNVIYADPADIQKL